MTDANQYILPLLDQVIREYQLFHSGRYLGLLQHPKWKRSMVEMTAPEGHCYFICGGIDPVKPLVDLFCFESR
jgi:hypothetical protein